MSILKCSQCGLVNFATAVSCRRCGNFFQTIEQISNPNAEPVQSAFGAEQSAADSFGDPPQSGMPPPNFSPSPQQSFRQPAAYQNFQTPPKQKIGIALTSMILGLIGCLLTAPVGLVLGIVALKKSNSNPREYGGKGFAIAGIVLNVIGILFLPLVAAIAIPNLLAAMRSANEASALSTFRTIIIAEEKYKASMVNRCGDIQSLIAGKLLDVSLAGNEKHGYRFMVVSFPAGGCEIYATPISTSQGNRSFYYSTEEGKIRAANKNGLHAEATDPAIDGSDSIKPKEPPKIATQKEKR